MPTIMNTEARLIWGPPVAGFAAAKWLPGKNPLDLVYWRKVEKRPDIARWVKLGWLVVDANEDMPDPNVLPTDDELAEFTERELGAALKNPNVPVQWHPTFEAELDKRKDAAMKARLSPAKPPAERKSLSGIKVEDALPLIAAESDVDTLEAWADSDKRKGIETAIDDRLAELVLDGKDEDEDEDEDEG